MQQQIKLINSAACRLSPHSAARAQLHTMCGPNQFSWFCPTWRVLQAKSNFFFTNHQKGHTSIIYPQTSDIYCQFWARALQPLSDRRKFHDNFANTAGTDPKYSAILFLHYQFITSITQGLLTSAKWCRGYTVHTANSPLQNRPLHSTTKKEFKRVIHPNFPVCPVLLCSGAENTWTADLQLCGPVCQQRSGSAAAEQPVFVTAGCLQH